MTAHKKHTKLTRPVGGQWGRTEIAILGAPCSEIKTLVASISENLASKWNIAYVDADHNPVKSEAWSALNHGAQYQLTDQINQHVVSSLQRQPQYFDAADLVLVNGNHFTAELQIAWIHPKKSLENKLEKLGNVQLVVLDDEIKEVPEFLTNHLKGKEFPVLKRSDLTSIINHINTKLENNIPALNGLILVGGQSTRMGQDKSRLIYHDGLTQVDYLQQLLNKKCNEVFVSVRDNVQAEDYTLAITDKFIGLGPYGGILSAFMDNPNAAWLVVAVDLPFLNKQVIDSLIDKRNIHKIATSFLDQKNEFPEPLITIWEPKAYAVLLNFLSKGHSCPRKALINSDVEIITERDIRALTNVNDQSEYIATLNSINAG